MILIDKLIYIFLAGLFGFSAIDKMFHLHGFVNAINSYAIITVPVGEGLAPLIIGAEMAIAVGMLLARWRRAAAIQAGILMVLFTTAIIVNRFQGEEGICGCWFSVTMAQGDAHVLFNAVTAVLCALAWHSTYSPRLGSNEVASQG